MPKAGVGGGVAGELLTRRMMQAAAQANTPAYPSRLRCACDRPQVTTPPTATPRRPERQRSGRRRPAPDDQTMLDRETRRDKTPMRRPARRYAMRDPFDAIARKAIPSTRASSKIRASCSESRSGDVAAATTESTISTQCGRATTSSLHFPPPARLPRRRATTLPWSIFTKAKWP